MYQLHTLFAHFIFYGGHMAIPIIPTLHSNVGILTEKSDIVAYVIRHVLAQSKKTSVHLDEYKVSFRKLEAEYGVNTEELREVLARHLDKVLYRYFSDGSVRVIVSSTPTDKDGVYTLEIKANSYTRSTPGGSLILTDANVSIKDGSVFNISFKGVKL